MSRCQVQRSSRRVRAGCGPGAAVGALHPGDRGAGGGGRDHLPLAGGRAGVRVSVCACAGADLAEGMLRAGASRHFGGSWQYGRWSCGPAIPAGTEGRLPGHSCSFSLEGSAGLRETRPRLPHLPALWLAFPFVLCPECLFTLATWVVSLGVGRAPVARGSGPVGRGPGRRGLAAGSGSGRSCG